MRRWIKKADDLAGIVIQSLTRGIRKLKGWLSKRNPPRYCRTMLRRNRPPCPTICALLVHEDEDHSLHGLPWWAHTDAFEIGGYGSNGETVEVFDRFVYIEHDCQNLWDMTSPTGRYSHGARILVIVLPVNNSRVVFSATVLPSGWCSFDMWCSLLIADR